MSHPTDRGSAGEVVEARFERLFLAYQVPILNYLYRFVGDVSRAEDMAQETFVKAYRALPRLPADANERAWLYRIATNIARDWNRRRKLIEWLPLLSRDNEQAAKGDHAGQIVESQAVQQALASLAPNYREPLILYSMQGFSTAEIAEILALSQSAVKVRLFRAREMFREAYQGETEWV
jgi:RNA polymerase sigma-70 factor, ECF subfamily